MINVVAKYVTATVARRDGQNIARSTSPVFAGLSFLTNVHAIISWSACFLGVHHASMNPIINGIAEMIFARFLPSARQKLIRFPLLSETFIPISIFPIVPW